MNSNETIGYRIKTLRKNKGLTQLQLAEKMFVSDKAVSKWETGEGNPELSILIKLAEFFWCFFRLYFDRERKRTKHYYDEQKRIML